MYIYIYIYVYIYIYIYIYIYGNMYLYICIIILLPGRYFTISLAYETMIISRTSSHTESLASTSFIEIHLNNL